MRGLFARRPTGAKYPPRTNFPQDTFAVHGPTGDKSVVGYMKVYPSGVLGFFNAEGSATHTFSPTGWWYVYKIKDAE